MLAVDQPVFCCHINREAHKFLGIAVNVPAHWALLRATSLATVRPLYASYAQVFECFHDSPSLLSEIKELSGLQRFIALSAYDRPSDFIDRRRRMYEWDAPAYPMYFGEQLDPTYLPTPHTGSDPDTTGELLRIYGNLYDRAAPPFENSISLPERQALQSQAAQLRKLLREEPGPITSSFLKRANLTHEAHDTISRLLPKQFTNIYRDIFAGVTPTGFPGFAFIEDDSSFPFLDFQVSAALITKLKLSQLLLDYSSRGTKQFLDYINDNQFFEYVKAKDFFLQTLLDGQGPRRSSQQVQSILRSMAMDVEQYNEVSPLIAAASLYRAADEYRRQNPSLSQSRTAMSNAQSWKGRYILFTATDIEDVTLHREFIKRGFAEPKAISTDSFSYLEYFRPDIGRVFHVRTSAGSGGASGSMLGGKNAISHLDPQFVISVGICLGLDEGKQKLGDVVVAEAIHYYEKQRVSKSRPEDRGFTPEVSPTLLSRARTNRIIWKGPPVHVGVVTSGEKLVDDRRFREWLKKLQPPAIAGEMEAWGLSAVCHELKKDFIMVKGICDWGYDKDKDQQAISAENAVRFTFDALLVP